MGSWSVGVASKQAAYVARRIVGMICPPPRWMASVCNYEKIILLNESKRVNMKTYGNIKHVHSDTTHIFFTSDAFLCRPLECGNTRVLNFVEVLYTLRHIDQQIGTGGIGTETPDLSGVSDIPTEFISKNTSTELEIVTRIDFAGLNGFCEFFINGQGLHEETVVLVLRFRQSNNGGLSLDSLTVRHDGVRNLKRNTGMVFLQILDAND